MGIGRDMCCQMRKTMKDCSIFLAIVLDFTQWYLEYDIRDNIQLEVTEIHSNQVHMEPSFGRNKQVHLDRTRAGWYPKTSALLRKEPTNNGWLRPIFSSTSLIECGTQRLGVQQWTDLSCSSFGLLWECRCVMEYEVHYVAFRSFQECLGKQ